jgi:hypothetical protein
MSYCLIRSFGVSLALTLAAYAPGDPPAADQNPQKASFITERVEGPAWFPAEVERVLPSGLNVRYSYHFDRNALGAACLVGDNLLAISDSGNLLRFDHKTLQLSKERPLPAAATCLAEVPGSGAVLGLADGRVCRVDPTSLDLTELARLPLPAAWVGSASGPGRNARTTLAVVEAFTPVDAPNARLLAYRLGDRGSQPSTFPITPHGMGGVRSYHLDRTGQLWIGYDAGEWSGHVTSVPLLLNRPSAMGVRRPEYSLEGVHGFLELNDGQVWAYGGTVHEGVYRGYVARIDRGRAERLGESAREKDEGPDRAPKRPRFPITHMVADPGGDGLLVFSFWDLFRVDRGLKNWQHLGLLDLRYNVGRPDAVGSYPAVRRVFAAGKDPAEVLATTARDGLLRLRGGKATLHRVGNQVGERFLDTSLPAVGGTVVSSSEQWREHDWQYSKGRWHAVPLAPSVRLASSERWYEHRAILDPMGRLVTISRTNSAHGKVVVQRWEAGKPKLVAEPAAVTQDFDTDNVFITPDGSYWCAGRNNLFRLENGRWTAVGEAPDEFLRGLRLVGDGPPWMVAARDALYRLDPGGPMSRPKLTAVTIQPEGGPVRDALAWERDRLLLATDTGLHVYQPSTGQFEKPPFPSPGAFVHALCRDGKGRTWLAGDGLWLVDTKNRLHSLEALPLPFDAVVGMARDSEHEDGAVLSLGQRGIVFLQASEPAPR